MEDKTIHVDNPDQYLIQQKPDFTDHRKKIQGWLYYKSIIWGGHRYDYYKIIPSKKTDATILKTYFSEDEIKSKKKKLSALLKKVENKKWIPIDRLYIKTQFGTIKNEEIIDKINLDISKKEDRLLFEQRNNYSSVEFLTWVLWIADVYNIKTISDIIDNEYILLTNFENFCHNDLLPFQLIDKFNEGIKNVGENRIEPIKTLENELFYKFVTNPNVVEISTSVALKKLLFLIKNSKYLRGIVGSGKPPSFEIYVNLLDKIFDGKYNDGYVKTNSFRRLKENEIKIYDETTGDSFIKDDYYIPNYIKKEYGLIDWNVKEIKSTGLTVDELDSYKRYIKDKNTDLVSLIEQRKKELIEKYVHSDVGVKAMNEMEREKTEVPSTKEDIDEHLKKIMNNDKS